MSIKKPTPAENRERVLGLASGFLDAIDTALVKEERKVTEKAAAVPRETKEQEHGDGPAPVHRKARGSLAMPRKVQEELARKERPIETK